MFCLLTKVTANFLLLGLCSASPGSAHSRGSVILYRPHFTLDKFQIDDEGRFVMAKFKIHEVAFCIVCVYAPHWIPDRDNFFTFCESSIDPSVPILLRGDFNAVFDCCLDRRGSSVFNTARESCGTPSALFDECCVADIWRILHPGQCSFSWTKGDGSFASHIDLVGCPFTWLDCVRYCDLLPCLFPIILLCC